jgi:hypothetical protein
MPFGPPTSSSLAFSIELYFEGYGELQSINDPSAIINNINEEVN